MAASEKNNSRLNAMKHGCCAKTLILPDECQKDFDQILDGWMAEFEPEGYQEMRLVEILILNDWHLQRAQLRLWEAEAALCTGPTEPLDDDGRELWEAQRQHDVELKQRYKTSCERALYRAWAALHGLRKDMERRQVALARLEAEKRKLEKELEAIEKKHGVKGEPESGEPQSEARRPADQKTVRYNNGYASMFLWRQLLSDARINALRQQDQHEIENHSGRCAHSDGCRVDDGATGTQCSSAQAPRSL